MSRVVGGADPEYQFRLFVSGATPRSLRVIAAVRRMCEATVAGRYSLEVIDIYRNPDATREDQIVAAPTLLRLAPAPRRLFIGDMAGKTPQTAQQWLRVFLL